MKLLFCLAFLSKSIPATTCFNRIKANYSTSRAKALDKVLKARCKLAKLRLEEKFYERCLLESVLPTKVELKITSGGLHASPSICERYMKAELDDVRRRMDSLVGFLKDSKDQYYCLDFISLIKFSKLSR